MPIQHRTKYRILSSVIDGTFGKSSRRGGSTATHFIKVKMPMDDVLEVKAQTLVVVPSNNVYLEMRPRYRQELLDLIEKEIKQISEDYEKQYKLLTSVTSKEEDGEKNDKKVKLTLDPNSIQEWLEHVSMSSYTTDKKCLYHLTCTITVS